MNLINIKKFKNSLESSFEKTATLPKNLKGPSEPIMYRYTFTDVMGLAEKIREGLSKKVLHGSIRGLLY